MQGLLDRLSSFWKGAGPNQKVLGGGIALLVLIGMFFLAGGRQFLGTPTQAPLFTNLQTSDAAAIVQKLQADKIPYQLSPDGSTIYVPQGQVAALRLEMASAGLPKQGVVGLEIFDQSQFGMTNFQQQVVYLQAQEGELDRTLDQIGAVAQARVSIVMPNNSVFTVSSQPATAAVFLSLKPFSSLTSSQVFGIINLVSHSVGGLSPKNVSVVDQNGNLLSPSPGAGLNGNTVGDVASSLAVQEQFGASLQGKLQSMLDQLYGPGNSIVQVRASLNLNAQSIKQLSYQTLPGSTQGVVVSQQTSQDTSSGTGGAAPAGTSSNVPPVYQGSSGGNYNDSKTTSTQNYDVGQTQTNTTVAPGTIKSLSVAVAVNKKLTPGQTAQLTKLIEVAFGYQAGRDQVTVTGLAFQNPLTAMVRKALTNGISPTSANSTFPYLAAELGGGGLLAAIILLLFLRRRAAPPQVQFAAVDVQPVSSAPVMVENKAQSMVEDLVKQRPETTAQILRAWLKEE